MTYSIDFRKKVLQVREKENLSIQEVAKRFGVGVASVMRWINKLEPQKNRNKPATKINMDALKEDLKIHPDGYLKERAERLNVSHNCVWRALRRLKITYKKNSTAPQSK
jgi:transposase